MSGRHIAVVPVFDGDSRAVLEHAARIAPEVIAIGFGPASQVRIDVPLVLIETRDRSWNQSVERVIELLKRHKRPDRITLVLSESLTALFAETGIEVAEVA